MKRLLLLLFTAAMFLTSTGLYAEKKVNLAVIDLSTRDVPKLLYSAPVADIVRDELANIENLNVLNSSQMKDILKNQKLQLTGCDDTACAVQFGKILSAERIVIGEIAKLKKGAVITLSYINVNNGKVLFTDNENFASLDEIDKAAAELAKRLSQRVRDEDKGILPSKTMAGYYVRSIVPGWGQFYAGKWINGAVSSTLFVGSCGLVYYMWADYKKKEKAYLDVPRNSDKFDSRYDDFEKAGKYFDISLYIIGGVYLLHWVDAIFLSRPDFRNPDDEETAFNSTYMDFAVSSMPYYNSKSERVLKASVGLRF